MVFSTLYVKFTTPRAIASNEELILDMGKDLNDVNTNIGRLSITLKNTQSNQLLRLAANLDG